MDVESKLPLLDRYRALLEELDARRVQRRILEIEDRLCWGLPDGSEEPLFAEELAEVARKGRLQREAGSGTRPDLLLVLLGYSPEPLLLAVAHHAPLRVLLLVEQRLSSEYRRRVGTLWNTHSAQLGMPAFEALPQRLVRDSPEELFQEVRSIVAETGRVGEASVVLDITGAKKTMIAGAFLAAGFLGIDASYVDFDEYDPVLRRPFPGTSRPRRLRHPERLFRLREEGQLREAFDDRRYEEAGRLAGSLRAMAESPDVAEVLGSREARRLASRHERAERAAEAYGFWAGGFYRDAAEKLAQIPGAPRPPSVEILAERWPRRTDPHETIVSMLAEEKVFARAATAPAYFLDVLVWMREERLARAPRECFLRLFGSVEALFAYVFHVFVGRRPERLQVALAVPGLLEELGGSFPCAEKGAPLSWEDECRAAALKALRQHWDKQLKLLVKGRASVWGHWDLEGLLGKRATEVRQPLPQVQCRLALPPLEARHLEGLSRKERSLTVNQYRDLRHKAVHFLAPVPQPVALELRAFLKQALLVLIPPVAEELRATLAPEREEEARQLEAMVARLLDAANGAVPQDCQPSPLEELLLRTEEDTPPRELVPPEGAF